MAENTKIQWCDTSVNPTSGCDGCELWNRAQGNTRCYAGNLHTRFQGSKAYPGPFGQIDLHPGRMAKIAKLADLTGKARPGKPWLDGMPRVIFLGDMGDVLSRQVPDRYLIDEILMTASSREGARHIWMLLTKQSRRLVHFGLLVRSLGIAWPANLWAGVSVTSKASLRRVDDLCNTLGPATRFVSAEPLVEDVDLSPYLGLYDDSGELRPGLDLVICGGESGHNARPFSLKSARSLRDRCRASGVPFFLKQLGAVAFDSDFPIDTTVPGYGSDDRDEHIEAVVKSLRVRTKDSHGGDWSEWPEDLRVREFPAAAAVEGPAY